MSDFASIRHSFEHYLLNVSWIISKTTISVEFAEEYHKEVYGDFM